MGRTVQTKKKVSRAWSPKRHWVVEWAKWLCRCGRLESERSDVVDLNIDPMILDLPRDAVDGVASSPCVNGFASSPCTVPCVIPCDDSPWVVLPSPHGVLTMNDLTFVSIAKAEWACATRGSVGWTTGKHIWTVTLGNTRLSVGISQKGIDFENASENDSIRYDLYCVDYFTIDPEANRMQCFNRRSRSGDKVSICLDLENGTVTYGLNGVWNDAPSFSQIPPGEWFPYFALARSGATFSVAPDTFPEPI